MPAAYHCRSATKVVAGEVQKKNNWVRDRNDYYCRRQNDVVIDRKRPGDGYRHLVTVQDVRVFLELLPDWDELAVGLEAVVLAPGEESAQGYHTRGVVHLCAWERELHIEHTVDWFEAHRPIIEKLGVPTHPGDCDDGVWVEWTEGSARAFQLLHVLLHEFGHHHDRITSRSRRRAARGEPYAEAYANAHGDLLWSRYCETFGLP